MLRGSVGSDTLIGSNGNDRFAGGGGGSSLFGGAGNDLFFETLNNHPGGARDSIDGGIGHDLLDIIMNTDQLTPGIKSELAGLKAYMDAGIFEAHFVSDVLHVDMLHIETITVRLDGVEHALADLLPRSVATASFATTGDVSLDGGDFSVGPAALSLNSDPIATVNLDTFLGLAAGAIETIGTAPTDGSAAKASIFMAAGEVVSFDWEFNAHDYMPFQDTAYAVFGSTVAKLSDAGAVGDYGSSGWQTGHFTADHTGVYTLGFAVTNAFDQAFSSNLHVDHVVIA